MSHLNSEQLRTLDITIYHRNYKTQTMGLASSKVFDFLEDEDDCSVSSLSFTGVGE